MQSQITKNQHYIPEALLWHFTDANGKLMEVLLGPSNNKIYPTNPSSSMCEKFAYENENLKVNTVEKYFAKIDSEIAPKIKDLIKLIDEHKNNKTSFLVAKEALEKLLPIFIVFYYRSGALLTEFSSIDKEDKIPLLSKKILNFYYIDLLADTIKNCYKFAILESNGDFLLSDQFLSTAALKLKSQFFNISNRHIGLKDTLILIPISSRYYGVYWHASDNFMIDEGKLHALNIEDIKLFNRTIINNSYIKCVGQKQESIENVLPDYKWAWPSHIFAGGNPSNYFTGAIKKKEVFFYEEEEKIHGLLEFAWFVQYKNLKRNDRCACQSGKKFKKCYEDAYNKVKLVMQGFGKSGYQARIDYGIPNATVFELPVDQWSGYSKNKSN